MHSIRTCWALWAIFLVALVPSCSASQHGRFHASLHHRRSGDVDDVSASPTQDIFAAQYETYINPEKGEKAEVSPQQSGAALAIH